MKNTTKEMILGQYWDLAYRAHSNTSFSPERRANRLITEFSTMLEQDLKELGENKGNYKEKFTTKFMEWMSAKGRCISSMITGPANFPVQRAQKANRAEHNKYQDLVNWRDRYFKAVNRIPTKSPEDELIIAERRLEELTNKQIEFKAINAAIRKSKLGSTKGNLARVLKHLLDLEFSEKYIERIDWRGGKYAVPSYALTNNNAKIKSTQQKIKVMQTRIERKSTWEDITFDGGYITIEDDRLKIFHDERPEKEIIQEIKGSGFRWSPFWKCWTRKHTGNAVFAAKQLSFVKH